MTCKKYRYGTRKLAKQWAKKLFNKKWYTLWEYKCETCWYYHLTRQISVLDKEHYRKNKRYENMEKRMKKRFIQQMNLEAAINGYTMFPYKSKSIINTTRQKLYMIAYWLVYKKNIQNEIQ